MPTEEKKVPSAPLTQTQMLSAFLQATGDLDTAEALQKSLPSWLLKTSPATLGAIDKTARDLHAIREKVDVELKRLQPMKAFCITALNTALSEKWQDVEFDVEHDHLELPGADCDCAPARETAGVQNLIATTQAVNATTQAGSTAVQAAAAKVPTVETASVSPAPGAPSAQAKPAQVSIPPATQSLLEAAMQNFTADEETADGFPAGSVVSVDSAPQGIDGLTPQAFAKVCRKLDLGKRYQEHFEQVFGLRDKDGNAVVGSRVTEDIGTLKKLLLQLDVNLALAKKHITPAGGETLQRLIDANGVVSAQTLHYRNQPLIMQGIEIRDSCIWGVVVFSLRSIETHPNEWCLVYMPGEPDRPVYDYPSFASFKEYLTLKLSVKRYKDYFANSLDEDNKVDFFKAYADKRDLGTIKALPITVSLVDFMVQSHLGKLQIDARKLVVPTTDVDEDTRKKRLLNYLEVSVTVASLAGFFIPVLGQLMMGVAVGQLLGEVYEGVEDWGQGDRQEALAHLLSVAENIVLMGATAGGQKIIASLVKKTVRAHPEFFAGFAAILDPAGKARLWRPQLAAYAQSIPQTATALIDAKGLFHVRGMTFGRIGDLLYAGQHSAESKTWRLEHPTRKTAFAPELQEGVEGGWRHPAEEASQWAGSGYTLKRIDPTLAGVEDLRLDMMRRLTQTPYDELHRTFEENLSLPPRLRDTIERFSLERRVHDFIADMQAGNARSTRYTQEQLYTLPKLKQWPTDRYIKVIDDNEQVIATYPEVQAQDDALSVVVTEDQLSSGELLNTVVKGLSQKEVTTLLGAKVASSEQSVQLAKKLGAAVKTNQRPLFEQLYQTYDQSDVDEVLKLRKLYPDLPVRYAQALIDRASSVQRTLLRDTGRVSMALAQSVRPASHNIRLDRALAGFYLPDIANGDTEKLAIQMLPRLAGWSSDVRLELHEGTLNGTLLEAIGETSATPLNTCKLVKSPNGYEAFDGNGLSSGLAPAGPDSLYEAILKALPPSKRTAAGFPDPTPSDSARLRNRLLETALGEREQGARMVAGGEFEPVIAEPNCVQADPPLFSSRHGRTLLRKVRKLFPLFTDAQAEAFLDNLGDDPLTRANRVKQLRLDLQSLRQTLGTWSEQKDETAGAAQVREQFKSRQETAFRIEDCFRRRILLPDAQGRPVCGLKLDGMRVGSLPSLPAEVSFEHIRELSLKNMQLGDDIGGFLKFFKQVETLQLDANQLTALPQALSLMPELKWLSMADNSIKLTEQSLAQLAELRTLYSLNLSGNRLGATPDVGKMFDLRYLSLRDTHATELPKGLSRLPNLDRVDLRNNAIKQLPAWLFDTPKQFSETINLRHNELSQASTELLTAYRDRTGIGMGYLEDDLARLDEQQARSLWFKEIAGTQWARREPIWAAFKDEPAAEGLFHLLAELGSTADSARVNEDMTRRVWEVLEAAESNATLREQVLDLAANPINCTDSAALNFSHLEVAVEVDKVTRDGKAPAAALLKLGRGLFRLEQLEQIAQEHVKKNPSVDPLEASLAYRTGLAEHYELPGQPRHMRFAALSGVKATDLESAKSQVDAAEMSAKWKEFIVRQPFWCDYLKRNDPSKFSAIDEIHAPKIQALFDKADTLTSAEYRKQMDGLMMNKEQAENELFKSLTTEALRVGDVGICAIPD